MEKEVVIVGAGIAGLATAIALKRIGVEALVLEKSESLQTTMGAALTLFPNAWFALDALGISHKLTTLYPPCKKGYITDIDTGQIQEVSFTKTGRSQVLRGVHRGVLLKALAEELSKDAIRFCCRITSIVTQHPQQGSSIAIIHMADGSAIKAKALIGCDGVHSVVARWLGLSTPVSSGRWAARGLSTFPQGHAFNYELQQFVTGDKRAGFVPLNDKELYWFLFCKFTPRGKEMRGNAKLIQKEVIESFAKDLPLLYSRIVQHSDLSTLTWAPVVFRFPLDMLFTSVSQGNITVAGDAMHPMTPDLGQNECLALEDAVVLGQQFRELISHSKGLVPGEVAAALRRFAQQRRWRAAGLMTTSYLSSFLAQGRGGSGWFMKLLRDMVFNRLVYSSIFNVIHFDCGKLPCISSNCELEVGTWKEGRLINKFPTSIKGTDMNIN